MSFIQMGRVHSGKELHSFNAQDDAGMFTPSQVARVEVVTAVIKSYHRSFKENHWPKVSASVLEVELKSRIGTEFGLRCYHPLNFCRLDALLAK